MNVKSLLRTGSAAAVAAVLAVGAVATPAFAIDEPNDNSAEARVEARQARQQARPQRSWQAPQQQQQQQQQQRTWQAPQQQRTYQAPVAQERSAREWSRGDRRSDAGTARSGREWNRGGGDWQSQAQAQAQANAQAAQRSGSWGGYRDRSGTSARASGGWERNRTYSDATRNQTYRDQSYRDQQSRQQQAQNAYRSGYREGYRTDRYRDDHRSWSRDWRRDNRYNWYSYRNSNRNIFRLGTYYSPYRNYRYSRVNIGFTLNSLFFGSRYWINDPWQYRLPEAYGPYRWIRYYDDALLVNTYSGEVVDVIYDFFW